MMKPLSGEEGMGFVEGLVYAKKQVRDVSIDLTVREVLSMEGASALDFGGGEYKQPDVRAIEPMKHEDEDEYGWWSLEEGQYLVKYNETVDGLGGFGLISPHPRLLKACGTHPTLFVQEWEKDYIMPLTVPKNGLRLKENARISKLVLFI